MIVLSSHVIVRPTMHKQNTSFVACMQGYRGALHMASMDAEMLGGGNASACIEAGTCQPLGGHTVWAALPPLPKTRQDGRPVTIVAAGIDSSAFFHARAKVHGIYVIAEPAAIPRPLSALGAFALTSAEPCRRTSPA
jgi:hypothetical protein